MPGQCTLSPHPSPSPQGRGILKPFSLREKGWDEGEQGVVFFILKGL
jgi:hypothetical protein